jgi:putative nucleotidyltransferase with HDIG domain
MHIRKFAQKGSQLPVVLLFMILFMAVFSVLSGDEEVATALYKEGIKKYILEDYKGAVQDFQSAYKLKPDDPKIRGMYINTLIKQGNIEYQRENLTGAQVYYKKALSLSGEDPDLQDKLVSIQRNIEEEKALREQESRVVVKGMGLEEEIPAVREGREPEITRTVEEVELPFDLDGYIRQQDEANRLLLAEVQEQQRQERERLLQSIEENQRIMNENMEAQRQERESFIENIEENRKILSNSFEEQHREREILMGNVQENQQILRENIERQGEEREYFLKNMVDVIQSQSEDRKLFSRSLLILVIGGVVISIIIVLGFIMLLRRRISQIPGVSHEPGPSIGFRSGPMLDYDETKYITDEHYSDMVKVNRLKELEKEIREGNRSWETIQGYLTELNQDVKSEILSIVEKKVRSNDTSGLSNAVEILLPFITDGDRDIGAKSKRLVRRIAGVESGAEGFIRQEEDEDPADPLSTSSLLNMATMADTKTGRINHSTRVAEIASKIAQKLNIQNLDPSVTMRVGLAHDIGYLEIEDTILKKEGELTERQFAIIKTHPERGLKLLQHIDLPQIFSDGIEYHHERLDGSGYPKGLTGEEIPIIAKVLAVADFFDAVTSARPHRPALTVDSAFDMMGKLAGKIFDRKIFEALISLYENETE